MNIFFVLLLWQLTPMFPTHSGVDQSRFDPNTVVTLRNADSWYWAVNLTEINVDGVSAVNGRTAVLDTGKISFTRLFLDH